MWRSPGHFLWTARYYHCKLRTRHSSNRPRVQDARRLDGETLIQDYLHDIDLVL